MLIQPTEAQFARHVAAFLFTNPMDDRAQEQNLAALASSDFGLGEEASALAPTPSTAERPWLDWLVRRCEALMLRVQARVHPSSAKRAAAITDAELRSYEDLILAATVFRFLGDTEVILEAGDGTQRIKSYKAFAENCRQWTAPLSQVRPFFHDPAHMFAVYFQLRRSFQLIHQLVQGNSRPAQQLRGAIWNSIFPREQRLYGALLFDRMHEVTTLILGPSGTGKELVATAIGLSRYVPFDAKRERFTEAFGGAFHPINLSAMPADLIESEMFGHVAGAFTGATKDRVGWFEKCALGHTVFLDEIGELAELVQVKLLRVLQSREFYRVGESEPRPFAGRVIAATNRDLGQEMAQGKFRQDLFFRLCSDVIHTPTLREQLDDSPGDLPFLVRLIATKALGARALEEHVEWLTNLTVQWIERSPELGSSYPWPGNFRELEQCVRSVLVRGEYHPPVLPAAVSAGASATSPISGNRALAQFVSRLQAGNLTFDEVLEQYCSLVFSRSTNLSETARKLGKHRATIESRIVPELVEAFRR